MRVRWSSGCCKEFNCQSSTAKQHTNVRVGMNAVLGNDLTVLKGKISPLRVVNDFHLRGEIFFLETIFEPWVFSCGVF